MLGTEGPRSLIASSKAARRQHLSRHDRQENSHRKLLHASILESDETLFNAFRDKIGSILLLDPRCLPYWQDNDTR